MQFELEKGKCLLASFNSRAEKNGEQNVSASDLKFETKIGVGDLAQFGPELRAAWYDETGGAPRLRNPKLLGPFEFDDEAIGVTVTVDYGIGGKSNIVLQECDVNAFRLEPLEGGTIGLTFRVQGHFDEKQRGKLSGFVAAELDITVSPPQADLPGLSVKEQTAGSEAPAMH